MSTSGIDIIVDYPTEVFSHDAACSGVRRPLPALRVVASNKVCSFVLNVPALRFAAFRSFQLNLRLSLAATRSSAAAALSRNRPANSLASFSLFCPKKLTSTNPDLLLNFVSTAHWPATVPRTRHAFSSCTTSRQWMLQS